MGLQTIRPWYKKPIRPLLLFALNKRDCLLLLCYIIKLCIYSYIYIYIYIHGMYVAWSVHIVNVVLQQHLQIITVRAGTDD